MYLVNLKYWQIHWLLLTVQAFSCIFKSLNFWSIWIVHCFNSGKKSDVLLRQYRCLKYLFGTPWQILCFLMHQVQVRARERSLYYGLITQSEFALKNTFLRNKASVILTWFTNQPESSGYFQLTLEHKSSG